MKEFIDERGYIIIVAIIVVGLLLIVAATDSNAFNRVSAACNEVGGTVVKTIRDYICVK